jgi:eukaryotic-like serine/threonine-protein kinase
VAYAIEIGRALSAAHAERLVHRDVKPQNVLIDPEGRAKVTDFGIARSLEAHGLTATGRVLGTTDYVAPEQALGRATTEQSDVYSLGIVLFEMLTGEVPFRADSQVAVAMKHVKDPLPDVQRLRPEVSAALASVVDHATAKEVENRYPTAADMVHDLEQVLAIEVARSGEAPHGEATTVLRALSGDTKGFMPVRLRNPRRWFLTVLAVLLLVGAAVAYFSTRTEKGPGPAVTPRAAGLSRVPLGSNAANDYDPQSDDKQESPDATRNAIDGNRTTSWDTETYRSDFQSLGKDGVGLYVDAGKAVRGRRLDLTTSTPGYTASIYAAAKVPNDITGWTKVSDDVKVGESERIALDTAAKKFRYYLVWITSLPDGDKAQIQELSLHR